MELIIPRQSRGLLNDKTALEKTLKTYNMSHAQVGPASYSSPEVNKVFRKEKNFAEARQHRNIDISIWKAENSALIKRGIGL